MRLWNALENIPGWSAVRSTWREHMGDELQFLEPLLQPMDQLAMSVPVNAHFEPHRVVQHADDDIVAVDPESGDVVTLNYEDIVLYNLDTSSLLQGIAEALDLSGEPASVGTGNRLWWLGEFIPFEGRRFPVYLTTSLDADELVSSAGIVSALSLRPFVFATPTRAGECDMVRRLVRERNAGWIVLDELVEWKGEGVFAARSALKEVLADFVDQHVPSTSAGCRARFPTPPGTAWADVRIRLIDGETVSVTVNGMSSRHTYVDLGMADKRSRRPTVQWQLLRAFADAHGELGWNSVNATRNNQKRRERLAKDLRNFFAITGDPFEYDDELKGWRTRFAIEPD